jgi:hypothetical protein
MQKQFEEWFKQAHTENVQKVDGEYVHGATERLWQAWQASRAAVVVKLPKPEFRGWVSHETIEGYKAAIDEVKYALDDAEVNYE